jgi:hypothetical protein
MNVSDKFKQIVVFVDKNRFISSLEQMTDPILLRIDMTRIPKAYILHYLGKRSFSSLNGQMDMVLHLAECVNAMIVSFPAFSKQKIKVMPVSFWEKNFLAAIAFEHHWASSDKKRLDNVILVFLPCGCDIRRISKYQAWPHCFGMTD